jgi:hypothetical protein
MENPVDEQGSHFCVGRSIARFRLTNRGRYGDHHITELNCIRDRAFSHSKGQDIRGAILPSILPIQPSHSSISDEAEAQLCRRLSKF